MTRSKLKAAGFWRGGNDDATPMTRTRTLLLLAAVLIVGLWLWARDSRVPEQTARLPQIQEPSASSEGRHGARQAVRQADHENAGPAAAVARIDARAGEGKRGSAEVPPREGGELPDAGARYSLDRGGLQRALAASMPEIDECYESWLRVQPTLGGRLPVELTIDTDDGRTGHVSRVSVRDAGTGNVAFEGCVLSIVHALPFEPPLGGEVTLSYPLRFVAPPEPSTQVRAELETLCQRIRLEALSSRHASVSSEDLLTVVLAKLESDSAVLKPYFASLLPGDVPPVQRLATFKRAISFALHQPWNCPAFDELWEGKRPL